MNKNIPTLTIGIAARNEANNLKFLLVDLLSQRHSNYKLERIVVMSDGSIDDTFKLAKIYKNTQVLIRIGTKRLGKPKRINQIFENSQSDVVVILDADVKLKNKSVLERLVSSLSNKQPSVSSGVALPFLPQTFIEHLAYAGVKIWHETKKLIPPNTMYDSEGMIRAFTKSAYKKINFPPTSAEDTYPYLMCKKHNWKFTCQKKAVVWYRLPSTMKEYRSQQRRYLTSLKIEETQFSKKLLGNESLITSKHKVVGLMHAFLKDPFYCLLYCVWSLFIRVDLLITPESYSSKWEMLVTTKRINI